MTKFDYKVVRVYDSYDSSLESKLRQFGEAGWELVSVKGDYVYIFRKKLEPQKDTSLDV